jgi:hypothetical protein
LIFKKIRIVADQRAIVKEAITKCSICQPTKSLSQNEISSQHCKLELICQSHSKSLKHQKIIYKSMSITSKLYFLGLKIDLLILLQMSSKINKVKCSQVTKACFTHRFAKNQQLNNTILTTPHSNLKQIIKTILVYSSNGSTLIWFDTTQKRNLNLTKQTLCCQCLTSLKL